MLHSVMNGRPTGKQVAALVALLLTKHWGDVVTHAEIEKVIGEQRGAVGNRYYRIVGLAEKQFFNETTGALLNIPGIGYQLPTSEDQMAAKEKKMRGNLRSVKRNAAMIVGVDDSRCNEAAMKKKLNYAEQFSVLGKAIRDATRNMTLVNNRPECLPRLESPPQEPKSSEVKSN